MNTVSMVEFTPHLCLCRLPDRLSLERVANSSLKSSSKGGRVVRLHEIAILPITKDFGYAGD
ncbi:hypothetical protein YH62_25315 [Rhizobium sp. LC145]|nr:hypothetical protein YH62_25315 [Rhizobium sp. LC145]